MLSLSLPIWMVLLALAVLLLTGVLAVLANEVQVEIQRHDLVVQSRTRRREYFSQHDQNEQPPTEAENV